MRAKCPGEAGLGAGGILGHGRDPWAGVGRQGVLPGSRTLGGRTPGRLAQEAPQG